MELVVRKNDLLKELSLLQGIVERKNTIPILANVLLDATKRCSVQQSRQHPVGVISLAIPDLFSLFSFFPHRSPVEPCGRSCRLPFLVSFRACVPPIYPQKRPQANYLKMNYLQASFTRSTGPYSCYTSLSF